VALGSNLGDRDTNLHEAAARIDRLLTNLRLSGFIETDPVGVGVQPNFLNAALTGFTRLGPRALLEALLAIEREGGRERPFPGAPRTIDLDLILHGDAVIDEPGLTVPHPRFRERRFVLAPLAEVAPDMVDPVTGKTVADLLEGLTR
jgi:2-amino-4-hydroxy-6-hydroxymethyldihydropteridine diphosphokinase